MKRMQRKAMSALLQNVLSISPGADPVSCRVPCTASGECYAKRRAIRTGRVDANARREFSSQRAMLVMSYRVAQGRGRIAVVGKLEHEAAIAVRDDVRAIAFA